MVATPKIHKVGINLNGLDLIRPKLTNTALSGTGELGFDTSTNYIKYSVSGNERTIGGSGTHALKLNEFKEPDGNIFMNGNKLTGLADGTNPQDAVTKAQLDNVSAGLDPKGSCRVSTVSDIGATYNPTGGTAGSGAFTSAPTTIDGITLANDNRILVRFQTDAKQNGIFRVVSSGNWERATDHDGTPSSEVSGGNYTFIEVGTTYGGTGWTLQGDGILTLNTDNLVWTQFFGASVYIGGSGMVLSGNTFNVQSANTGIIANTDNIELNLATTSGLVISSGLAIDDTVAGNGLTISSKILEVGAGDGITVNANDVALASSVAGSGLTYTTGVLDIGTANTGIVVNTNNVELNLASTSGLVISSGLALDDNIAGSGLAISGKVLSVGAGDGITVNANDVTLANTVAGNGLTYTAGVLDVVSSNSGIAINANNLALTLATDSGLAIISGLKIVADTTGGVNLGTVIDVNANGIAVKIDDTTIGTNGSNRLFVKNNSISETQLTTSVAGNGLTGGNGTALAVGAGTGITVNANDVAINTTVVARKFIDTTTVTGDDVTTDFVITHGLGNQFVVVSVIDESSLEDVVCDIERTSTNTSTVKFAVAPATGEDYTVVIVG